MKIPEWGQNTHAEVWFQFDFNSARVFWRRSGDFHVNFEHISHLFLVFLLLTLNR